MERYRPIIIITCLVVMVFLVSYLTSNFVSVKKSAFETYSANTDATLVAYHGTLEQITKQLTENSNNLVSLQDSLTKIINDLQVTVNRNNSAHQSQLDSIAQQLSAINNSITTHESYINNLISAVDNKISKSELDYFKSVIDNDVSVINNMQKQLSDMQTVVASLTSEIRGYSIQGKVKLVGASDYNPTVTPGANALYLVRFQCTQTGVLNLIRLRATNYGGVKVAVYSDNSSVPSQLLTSNVYDNIVSSGWSTITVSSINVVSGQYYWLAYNSATACIGWTNATTGLIYYKSANYTGFTFPDVINTTSGYTKDTRLCLISGWTGF